jgi:aconitate hydratase
VFFVSLRYIDEKRGGFMDHFQTRKKLKSGKHYYSLPALEEKGVGKMSRLPVSIRIMLESLLRHCDGMKVKPSDIEALANWNAHKPSDGDVPFVVARVLLQDFTGVPLLVDLAAMRDAVAAKGFKAGLIEPQVPVDLVIDHSVQVDRFGTNDAFMFNLKVEFDRNEERYEFLKWGQEAFETFKVVPPGIGICHQVNLEYLGSVVIEDKEVLYPDTLVGTDSHTTMINGLGVVGWGVGGIEAEAAMLGQPVSIQTPEVIGVHLSGRLKEGVTATDLTLRITELLRKEKVVGKFVEFFGEGTATLAVADRATIANMSPEYGATMGFFPCDEKTLDYLRMTGRSEKHIEEVKEYLIAQHLFGIPKKDQIDYTKVVELDLGSIAACVAGPKRPQDRINVDGLKSKFQSLMTTSIPEGGYGKEGAERSRRVFIHADGVFAHDSGGTQALEKGNVQWSEDEMVTNRPFTEVKEAKSSKEADIVLSHGSVVIAAITSCTNTSNPSVMIGAGLVAKKAVMRGLKVNPLVKTSLAPGSRVVTDYLHKSGLQKYLDELGFQLVAYGCTTCIGNSGPLEERIEKAIQEYDLVAASVLSGNRNFEARIHSSIKANFLMSPPLVVAFALAGRIDIDLTKEPLGIGKDGVPVFLRDLWPTTQEIHEEIKRCLEPTMFKERYAHIMLDNPVWDQIEMKKTAQYSWDPKSTYIQPPPYFEQFSLDLPPQKELKNMRALALFGDSVTTDHISPAGAFSDKTPAGQYLRSLGVKSEDFNSYGSRRGNHNVMMRGTFANVRIVNKMAGGKEGGVTKMDGKIVPIFDACQSYAEKKIPLIIFAGKDYGMGSSRDWAAKGTALLGVRVVVARSFERIHRSNLIGMGVLPLEFQNDASFESLGITGDETFAIKGLQAAPQHTVQLEIAQGGKIREIPLTVRLDTPIEVEYYRNGGIMPYVLRSILQSF